MSDATRFYQKLLGHEVRAKQLGWISEEAQSLNFKIMLDLIETVRPIAGLSIHDVGCGHGDLIPHLEARGIASYVGSDVMDEALTVAQKVYPGRTFVKANAARAVMPEVDLTVSVGAFAFNEPHAVQKMLKEMFAKSRVGIAFFHWHNLPEDLPEAARSARTQAVVESFVAKAQAAHKLARIEDYGMPYEGVRVLLK